MRKKVYVVAAGSSKFGELWDKSPSDLVQEAWAETGVRGREVGAVFAASMASGIFLRQENLGAFVSEEIGAGDSPAVRVEAACASGGAAFRQGVLAIESGRADVAAVVGVEKMTDVSSEEATRILALASDFEREGGLGATFPALYGLIASRHFAEFGTREEDLARIAVKNHENACLNEKAHFFGKRISLEQVLGSPYVARPLKVFDCSPISDGAAALVLCSEEKLSSFSSGARVLSCEHASDSLSLGRRASLTSLAATRVAGERAFSASGITPAEISFAEVHDCFTIAEILALEDLGLFGKGRALDAVREGATALGGKLPVNPSGGLKGKGHPVGATGVSQVAENYWQLVGKAGRRQVSKARFGLAHNVSGSGSAAIVSIFGREDS